MKRGRFRGVSVTGVADWRAFLGLANLISDVNFKIIDVLDSVRFTDLHPAFPLERAVFRVPFWKRRRVEAIIRQHRETAGINSVQDTVDDLRVCLGDTFFPRHEKRYFDKDCFNIVIGIQTPAECEYMRRLGFKLLYWNPPFIPKGEYPSRWIQGYTYTRVLWDETIDSRRPIRDIVATDLCNAIRRFLKDYGIAEEGKRPVIIPSRSKDKSAAVPKSGATGKLSVKIRDLEQNTTEAHVDAAHPPSQSDLENGNTIESINGKSFGEHNREEGSIGRTEQSGESSFISEDIQQAISKDESGEKQGISIHQGVG